MSKRLKPELPDELMDVLGGKALDRHLSKVILLITLDVNGWPYAAMLSLLETVAIDRQNIRIAPWNSSSTTANMLRNGKVALLIIDEGLAYYIQGTATEMEHEMEGHSGMAKINIKIDALLLDNALNYEGAARITTGIRFENPDMDAEYIERGRAVLEALRKPSRARK